MAQGGLQLLLDQRNCWQQTIKAILCDANPPSLRARLAPILRSCEAFDAAGNADGTVLCVCEAYFVARSVSLQLAATLSSAISGAAPSKMVSKALK